MAQHARVLVVRCYQLLLPAITTMVPSIYDSAASACCIGWCVVREMAYFVVDCCVVEGIVVEHCCCTCSAFFGPRTTRHGRAREEAATKTERRAFGGYLLHVVQFGRGGYQCALLLCVYQFIEIRCARFYVYFCGSK